MRYKLKIFASKSRDISGVYGDDAVHRQGLKHFSFQNNYGSIPRLVLFLMMGLLFLGLQGTQLRADQGKKLRIATFGDSLSAGYGLVYDAAFPVLLEAALKAKGHHVEIVNASVSGDTTQAGLARLEWSIGDDIDGVILELGANDALRGLDPALARTALDDIITRLKARGIFVLLAGMRAPPNLGFDYGARFDAIFPDLAKKHDLVFYPFFLEGVAGRHDLNLADGIHPTKAGVQTIVNGILPTVESFLERLRHAPPR